MNEGILFKASCCGALPGLIRWPQLTETLTHFIKSQFSLTHYEPQRFFFFFSAMIVSCGAIG